MSRQPIQTCPQCGLPYWEDIGCDTCGYIKPSDAALDAAIQGIMKRYKTILDRLREK